MAKHTLTIQLILILSIIACVSNSYSQFVDKGVGSGGLGLARSGVAFDKSTFPGFFNPALNSIYREGQISTYYTRLFNLNDLTQVAVNYSREFRPVGVGIGFESFGNALYRENRLLLNFNRKLRSTFRVGLGLNYYQLSVETFGSASTIGGDLGVLYKPIPDISVGLRWHNFNSPNIGQYTGDIPTTLTIGTALQLIPELTLLLDFVRENHLPTQIRFGQEATITDYLILRLGLGREPNILTTGMGLLWRSIIFDYSFITHPSLGLTHTFSVSYAFSEKKKLSEREGLLRKLVPKN